MRGWVSPGCPHPLCQELLEWLEGAELTLSAPRIFGFPFVRSGIEVSKPCKALLELFAASSCFAREQRSLAPAGGLARTKSSIAGCSALCRMRCQPSGREGAGGVPGKVGRAGSTPGQWEVSLPKQDELQAPSKPFWDAIIPAIIPSVELDLWEFGEKIHECEDQMWVLWSSVTYHCQGDLEGSVKSFLESSAGDTRMLVSSFGFGSF